MEFKPIWLGNVRLLEGVDDVNAVQDWVPQVRMSRKRGSTQMLAERTRLDTAKNKLARRIQRITRQLGVDAVYFDQDAHRLFVEVPLPTTPHGEDQADAAHRAAIRSACSEFTSAMWDVMDPDTEYCVRPNGVRTFYYEDRKRGPFLVSSLALDEEEVVDIL